MKKRILSILLILALIISLSATFAYADGEETAAESENTEQASGNTEQNNTETPTQTEEPKETETPTQTEDPKEPETPTQTEEPKDPETPTQTEETKDPETPAQNEEPAAGEVQVQAANEQTGPVTIYYTNDVHTYIANDGIRYSTIAGLKESTQDCLLVDAGDHLQGTPYGAQDNGKTIVELMNLTGYNLATPGNHEFDYGMDVLKEDMALAKFNYLSCNFYNIDENGERGTNVLMKAYAYEVAGVKIAFVGVTTPESITKSTPAYFQDDSGNYIYGVSGGEDGKALYTDVQQAIDFCRENGADYVIVLGHLGDDPSASPWTSAEVIANVSGLDAFIDGHSHSTVTDTVVADKEGKDVILTQTGSYLSAVGKLVIDNGTITATILTKDDLKDVQPLSAVKTVEDKWIQEVNDSLSGEVAKTDITFRASDETGFRLVRNQETNLGDLNADAFYYYINKVDGIGADVAIINGGGIRADVPSGVWTMNTCKTVNPFGNVLCVIKVTGQQILDALEWGARTVKVGEKEECGAFLQTAGLKYTINPNVASTVQKDANGTWTGGPTGDYKVSNVQVYNRVQNAYEDLNLEGTYTLAGINYTLRNGGDGCAMFAGSTLVKDYIAEDYIAFSEYLKAFGKKPAEEETASLLTTASADETSDLPYISSATSPLAEEEGYGINYEEEGGAGRITICEHPTTEVRNQKDATCKEAGYTGDTYCTECKGLVTEGTEIPKSNEHGETELRNVKKATCEEGYSGDTYCMVCGELLEEGKPIPASTTLHTYTNSVVFNWSSDNSSCTATGTCIVCGFTETQPCVVTTKITKAATRVSAGSKDLTAAVVMGGKTYTDKKTVVIPANSSSSSSGSSGSYSYSSTTGKNGSPATGDTSNPTLYITTVGTSLMGIALVTLLLRKKERSSANR